ncbi:MAG: hypothetical protein J6Z50_04885, partial [Fibrobacterales bacterium]|nr:hypothetical protein [Fibrobacterales bacterium]
MPAKKTSAAKAPAKTSAAKQTMNAMREAFDRHLRLTLAIANPDGATTFERYLAIAYAVRDRMTEQWVRTQETYRNQ